MTLSLDIQVSSLKIFKLSTLRSDGITQHFKQRYTLSWMTTLKESVAWEFSATSHGKGDTDGIGGTCKRGVLEKACVPKKLF